LIPSAFGLALVVLGLMASSDAWRKTAMHLAAVVGLLGFVAAAGRLVMTALKGSSANPVAAASQGIMAAVCGVFLFLCIQSFREARRRRRAAEVGVEPPADVVP
jgi:hypothetical protein